MDHVSIYLAVTHSAAKPRLLNPFVHHLVRPSPAMESLRQPPPLPDELLEEILLRIACHADLARASAACASFRRLITDPDFLRCYRSRHLPLLLGFVGSVGLDVRKGFHALEAPHPNARAARALANLSFDFLPPTLKKWFIGDVRDGRVLFECYEHDDDDGTGIDAHLAVWDPSLRTRQNLLLAPVPHGQNLQYFEAVFDPCAHEDDDTLFRVISVMYYHTKLVVLVFDSASGSWTIGTSASWDALSFSNEDPWRDFSLPFYAYGCFYWKDNQQMLKLDIGRMEFSTVNLPPSHEEHYVVVVEAGEDRLGMFSYNPNNGKFLNYYNSMQNEDQRTKEWQIRKVIPLPVYDDPRMFIAHQGCVFIQADSNVQDTKRTTIYSLDIKTLKLEMVFQMSCSFHGYPYFGG